MKDERFNLLVVVLFSIFAIIPLFKAGFPFTNDMPAPVYRLVELDVSIRGGELFPRWSPDLYGGRGAPLFHFYAPLAYYAAEAFNMIGFSAVNSIKAIYVISFPLSGVLMYLFARERMGQNGAIAAAILYMYAPYRFEDVYARGAFSEAFTFVLMPLVLYSFHSLAEKGGTRYITIGSLSFAGLILTHNAIALFFTGFLLFYGGFLFREFPTSRGALGATFVLGLTLSSFFWLPALTEKEFAGVEEDILVSNYDNYFLKPGQLVPSLSDFQTKSNHVNHLAARVGILHLAGTILTLYYIKTKYIGFLGLSLAGTLFLMSSFSEFLWEGLPLLRYTQFPFRLFTLVALLTSILGGFLVDRFLVIPGRRGVIYLVLLSLVIVHGSLNHIGSEMHFMYEDGDFTPSKIRELNTGLTYKNEYMPRDGVILPVVESKVETVGGDVTVYHIYELPESLRFKAAGGGGKVMINTYYFPGWTVYVDGALTKVVVDEKGLMVIEIGAGVHDVEVQLEDTPVRKFAEAMSFLALLALVLASLFSLKMSKNGQGH